MTDKTNLNPTLLAQGVNGGLYKLEDALSKVESKTFNVFLQHLNLDNQIEVKEGKKSIKYKVGEYTLLHAARLGHLHRASLLLKNKKINPSVHNNLAFKEALFRLSYYDVHSNPQSCRNQFEIIKLFLLDKRVDPSVCDNLALQQAASYGNLVLCNTLLNNEKVSLPTKKHRTILEAACAEGHFDVVQCLLKDKRVDPLEKESGALWAAVVNGHIEIIKLLLTDGRANPSECEALVKAAKTNGLGAGNQPSIVKLLLRDQRIDATARNRALIAASEWGDSEVINVLAADPSITLSTYKTACNLATQYKHTEAAKLLTDYFLKKKTNPESSSHNKETD